MKLIIFFFLLSVFSTPAFSHPGSSTLTCKSEVNSSSKQSLEIFVKRANGLGWGSPTIEVTIDKKLIKLATPDDMNNYGETFHNSPLKVIRVSAIVEDSEKSSSGAFSVVAIPHSVKAFNELGEPIEWSLNAENDDCYDVHGKAVFKGILRGYIQNSDLRTDIEAQVLDCTLVYSSGMSC